MPELVANCPRCDAKDHTFIVKDILPTYVEYDWKRHFEGFCVCKNCFKSTTFKLSIKNYEDRDLARDAKKILKLEFSLNNIMKIEGYVNIRNMVAQSAPKFTPENIEKVFKEGSESVVGGCPNAAAAMFRLCVDLVTKSLLPPEDVDGINKNIRRNLKPRLDWLFKTNILHKDLEILSDCIREDGKDGVHDGTLTSEDAKNLMDFTSLLLERLFTVPARLELANARRQARRDTS